MSDDKLWWDKYKKPQKQIKHHHPHTDIFVQNDSPKCRFKVGSLAYIINNLDIQTAKVVTLEYADRHKAWIIRTSKGAFLDKKNGLTRYPYRKKINALNVLHKRIKSKLWEITEQIEEITEEEN